MPNPDFFDVAGGLQIDDAVCYIFGSGPPSGERPDEVVAGSIYSDTLPEGSMWKKYRNGVGLGCWCEMARTDPPIHKPSVIGTTVLDQVEVARTVTMLWAVSIYKVDSPSERVSMIINALHDGTDTIPATNADMNISSKLTTGMFKALDMDVNLTDFGGKQVLQLVATFPEEISVTVVRIMKDVGGSSLAATSDPVLSTQTTQASFPGDLVKMEGKARWYPPKNCVLTGVYISAGTAPSGGAATFKVKKNGVEIAAPSLNSGANKSATFPLPGTVTVDDYLTVDVDAPASASDVTVFVSFKI